MNIDSAVGSDCEIDVFELSYKITNGVSDFETYDILLTEPFVFDAVTGELTVVSNELFDYTLKLAAISSKEIIIESNEFQVTSSCGISEGRSSFNIAIPLVSEYIIDGN